MNVAVFTEVRFLVRPDGSVWTISNYEYSYWKKYYLSEFGEVTIVARSTLDGELTPNYRRVDGPNVFFRSLPYYIGLKGFILTRKSFQIAVLEILEDFSAIIFRVPTQPATIAFNAGVFARKNIAVEIVGDPKEVFRAGVTNRILDNYLGYKMSKDLRKVCLAATASLYVTQTYLQEQYPPLDGTLTLGCSDVELPKSCYADAGRKYPKDACKLLFIGTLEQKYKGLEVLIRAIKSLADRGCVLTLTVLGEGQYRESFQNLTNDLGCGKEIEFLGAVDRDIVLGCMRSCDLFVMPSLTEGLPRALIEAMSQAMPCVASSVGGIPELLDAEYLVEKGNTLELADKILEITGSASKFEAASLLNLVRARDYSAENLSLKRKNFYKAYAASI